MLCRFRQDQQDFGSFSDNPIDPARIFRILMIQPGICMKMVFNPRMSDTQGRDIP